MCQLYMDQTGFKFPTIFGDAQGAAGWDLPACAKVWNHEDPARDPRR